MFLVLVVLNCYVVDAHGAFGLQMNRIRAAHDQGAVLLGLDVPGRRVGVSQVKSGSFERIESPISVKRGRYIGIKAGALQRVRVDHESALLGVRRGGQVRSRFRLLP